MSIRAWQSDHRRFWPFCILLMVTLLVEGIAAWCYFNAIEFVVLYHIYVIIEYILLTFYFMQLTQTAYRTWMKWSIPFFIILSGAISMWWYNFKGFPGININVGGILISVHCTYTLFMLDVRLYDSIRKHPDFWICVGLLAFFVGTFFSNGMYRYLQTIDMNLADNVFSLINKPLNLILYSCMIIGFIYAKRHHRSSPRSYIP